jgi:DNA-binding response OmpR family regulator
MNETSTPNQPKSKILIIEDDKFLRDLLSQKLMREGFKVLTAVEGEEGIKMMGEEAPNLVMLDLILPGLDGFDILTRLKETPELSSVPVLVLSNLGQKEDIERAMSLGAEEFLIKANFTPGEIVEKIKVILKKRYL